MKSTNWFEVDRKGLAKLLSRRGKEFILYELVSNSWDEPGVTRVDVTVKQVHANVVEITVEDDAPLGFSSLANAFTLFAESGKKSNATQRGRFNLGEKLVLAASEHVCISTTKGTLYFDSEGRRASKNKRETGSKISCWVKVTEQEYRDMLAKANLLLQHENIVTIINGEPLAPRIAIGATMATLQTEIADADGFLRRSNRTTTIEAYRVRDGETAMIYELGVPVSPTGDKWHYNIKQKVPLALDRADIPAAFVKAVRVAVFSILHDKLTPEDANAEWIEVAANDPHCDQAAMKTYMELRFGGKRVSYDASDPEANKIATSQGYTVVTGSMMGKTAWANAREAEAIKPAGKVTPSARVWSGEDDPNAPAFTDWIPESRWTEGMRDIEGFARTMAMKVLNKDIEVKFCSTHHHKAAASYGPSCGLVFNKLKLGNAWFERGINQQVVALLIHEFGHEYSSDHLSEEYYEALCTIGAKMFDLGKRQVL